LELAQGLWGARFEALQRWHVSAADDNLPKNWNRAAYPLWPSEFGGSNWRTGSGALEYSEPQMYYGVSRSSSDRERLRKYLGRERADELFRLQPSSESEFFANMFEPTPTQTLGAIT
jgi:hypothetical protein